MQKKTDIVLCFVACLPCASVLSASVLGASSPSTPTAVSSVSSPASGPGMQRVDDTVYMVIN